MHLLLPRKRVITIKNKLKIYLKLNEKKSDQKKTSTLIYELGGCSKNVSPSNVFRRHFIENVHFIYIPTIS